MPARRGSRSGPSLDTARSADTSGTTRERDRDVRELGLRNVHIRGATSAHIRVGRPADEGAGAQHPCASPQRTSRHPSPSWVPPSRPPAGTPAEGVGGGLRAGCSGRRRGPAETGGAVVPDPVQTVVAASCPSP